MSRNRFWGNFWGETGRNSGKWISNKVFGPAGWATPRRHIFGDEIKKVEKEAKISLDNLSNSRLGSENASIVKVTEKNSPTNEHDVKIAEIESKNLSETFQRERKENKSFILTLTGIFVVMFTFIIIMHNLTKNNRIADDELHLKLEKIELQINSLIKEGKLLDASSLIFDLNHPSQQPIPSSNSVKEWLNGQETYNSYWTKKRTYYLEQVK